MTRPSSACLNIRGGEGFWPVRGRREIQFRARLQSPAPQEWYCDPGSGCSHHVGDRKTSEVGDLTP
jgi:hypothetical protein